MTENTELLQQAKEEFELLISAIRPKLHRYCSRMTGSAIDAEDVVQDSLAKAYYMLSTTKVDNLEPWLFRIVHNKAIDALRAAKSSPIVFVDEIIDEPTESPRIDTEEAATIALSVFLNLTPMQRSCVILKDVIGYSAAEIAEILNVTVGATKAALHRGRGNLRELANSTAVEKMPVLSSSEAQLIKQYVDCFNSGDFDSIRNMLSEDVHLDLVSQLKKDGAESVGQYFGNYAKLDDLHFTAGIVESRPAVLVSQADASSHFIYVILISFDGGRVSSIRDYRYAQNLMLDLNIASVN